ncbi:hypothetical protein ACSQ6I_16415 [Anabaena sp. WFMT]|uniref:hypothetical protein n=1 Tax=Anabaena sp. WFMT TaxID=3449730 RepID=UPI003F1FDF34
MKMINTRQIFTNVTPEESATVIGGGPWLITLNPTDYSYILTREIDGIPYKMNGYSDLGSLIGSLGSVKDIAIEFAQPLTQDSY